VSGHDNTVRYSTATGEQIGVHLAINAFGNHVLNNLLQGNNMVDKFHSDPAVDLGAWGALSDGDNNEIAYNLFRDNRAVCSNQGYRLQSNSIELFTAVNNSIHHNISLGDRVFSELGSSAAKKSRGNVYAYNVFANSIPYARFLSTRGALDHSYGPVFNTMLYHNSVYVTGANSNAIACGRGCDPTILTTDSNIFWSDGPVLFADNRFAMKDDLYWATNGRPTFNIPSLDPSGRVANPQFTNAPAGDLHLLGTSPAIGHGTAFARWLVDAYGALLPPPPTVSDTGAAQASSAPPPIRRR
jgi:hypothetical protein